MGVVRSIEQRLENLVEGFFARAFRSGLQPVEVGRRILRAMGEGKTVSVNRIYAPNDFRVELAPEDFARFSGMEAGLVREFAELVIEQAKQNRWNLMGAPRFSFIENASLGTGQFRLEAALSADAEVPSPRAATHEAKDSTGAIEAAAADRLGLSAAAELLVLGEDGSATERIAITRQPVVIGRLTSNDVVLSDPNVSRRHAELRRDGPRWILVDLGSTNGTLVNGKLAREHELSDGDRLGFGTSELIFRSAG